MILYVLYIFINIIITNVICITFSVEDLKNKKIALHVILKQIF